MMDTEEVPQAVPVAPQRIEPVIDEDGFQLVQNRRKGKGR